MSENNKAPKPKKLRNALLLKKGGYSIVITALFIVGIIVLNILVSALNTRFDLDIDMTADEKHSISEENVDFIREVDQEIDIIVCSPEESYADNVLNLLASVQMITSESDTSTFAEYFNQTIDLVNKYAKYNKNFNLRYVDTQTTEYTEIKEKYSVDNPQLGAIIVGRIGENDVVRRKILGVTDIYVLQEDTANSMYSMYGMSSGYTIEGNNIETALTGAIEYVTKEIDTNVTVLTGHSTDNIESDYVEMLKKNNYNVTTVSDKIIDTIPKDTDVLVIPGAVRDFSDTEIKTINAFLENDGKLGKGLIAFASASASYLKNYYSFLGEWGVEIDDGILYETNSQAYIPGDNTIISSENTWVDGELYDISGCWTGNNVPMKVSEKDIDHLIASALVATSTQTDLTGQESGTAIAAPKDRAKNWKGESDYTKSQYATLIECIKSTTDENDEDLESRVAVFSSTDFISSELSEAESVTNKEATLAMLERAAGITKKTVSYIPKSISATESFQSEVTESDANLVKVIFMFIVPILVIATGIVVYIRRRNS